MQRVVRKVPLTEVPPEVAHWFAQQPIFDPNIIADAKKRRRNLSFLMTGLSLFLVLWVLLGFDVIGWFILKCGHFSQKNPAFKLNGLGNDDTTFPHEVKDFAKGMVDALNDCQWLYDTLDIWRIVCTCIVILFTLCWNYLIMPL